MGGVPFALLWCLQHLAWLASGAVLSSSSLEGCVKSSATDISCSKKIVLTVSIGNGQGLATQQLEFQLSCVGSSTGSCPCPCNYALDPSCTCRDLSAPLTISLTKTPMWATYPLQYLQSFNYKPYEVVVRPSSRVCTDGDYESTPTCGWYYVKGAKVTDSQGFTCTCSSSQIWDTTFGGSNLRTRANLDCDFWSGPLDILLGKVPCSAHCLEFDPLWYSGYQLGGASLQMSINVNIGMPTSTSGGNATSPGSGPPPPLQASSEVLQLSPSLPLAVSSTRLVSAQLLGDLATYTQLPALSNLILLVPQPSGSTPDQILASDRSKWLLLDTSLISQDGRVCDKVGTAFSAFRFQGSGCSRAPQVCLANQIKDLIEVDQQRILGGKPPLYLVTRYTYGSNSTLMSFSAGPVSFAVPVTSTSTSLVVLSVSADGVRFVTNVATGVISSMQLCTFAEVSCGGFEAGASRGYLWLNLTNTGSLAADFTITVRNCSSNVLPIEAQTVSLPPKKPTLISPPLTIYVSDSSADPDRYCWVTLYDSQGQVSDRARLTFYTNATQFTEKPTGGYNGTGDGVGVAKGAVDCTKACTNAVDVLCFVANGCWGRFGGFLGIVAGVATLVALLAVAAKAGLLASLCSGVASKLPCGGGGGGPADNGQTTNASDNKQGAAKQQGQKAEAGNASGESRRSANDRHYEKHGTQKESAKRPLSPSLTRAPSPSLMRPQSPSLMRPPSPSLMRPQSPSLMRPQSPSHAGHMVRANELHRTEQLRHDNRAPNIYPQPSVHDGVQRPLAQHGPQSPQRMLPRGSMASADAVARVQPRPSITHGQTHSTPNSPHRPGLPGRQITASQPGHLGMAAMGRAQRQHSRANPLYDHD